MPQVPTVDCSSGISISRHVKVAAYASQLHSPMFPAFSRRAFAGLHRSTFNKPHFLAGVYRCINNRHVTHLSWLEARILIFLTCLSQCKGCFQKLWYAEVALMILMGSNELSMFGVGESVLFTLGFFGPYEFLG